MAQGNGNDRKRGLDPERVRRWLDSLRRFDPEMHSEIQRRRGPATYESNPDGGFEVMHEGPDAFAGDFETLVRPGRPALLVKQDAVTREDAEIDDLSRAMVERVMTHAATINSVIPLVGRIDVANSFFSVPYMGTGWMVGEGLVVTNRHVAEFLAQREGGKFVFRPGRFGEPLRVSLDYKHEFGSSASDAIEVQDVLWIEPDARKADIAFLRLRARPGGTRRSRIELATEDAKPGKQVVVIGYPARAQPDVIPDQEWMDRVYRKTYDIKRVAPGLMQDPSKGWVTHDCTTLGGNSGSVVLDPETGKAVALHFAGLYMIENYAVPASTVAAYLKSQPWIAGAPEVITTRPEPQPRPVPVVTPAPTDPIAAPVQTVAVPIGGTTVSFELPLRITVSVGQPRMLSSAPESAGIDVYAAAREYARAHRGAGVLAVRPGYVTENGRMSDRDCIVVAAAPERRDDVAAGSPATFAGYPVEVRNASISDQLGFDDDALREGVSSVSYDDDARTDERFSFDEVDDEMRVVCHVGPEYSWEVLEEFLQGTRRELVSSMYEFHADHIRNAVGEVLRDAQMRLVVDPKTRDPRNGEIPDGDFDRSETFDGWRQRRDFQWIFVPLGGAGLVASSYHIKVSVRDGEAFWLSSGNWKQSSQPLIRPADRSSPRTVSKSGNREWHAVVEHAGLAKRFRAHILQDFKRADELGGTLEAPAAEELYVDVPERVLEGVEFEAPATRLLAPLRLHRRVRVQPLLTPDRKGAVFSDAVLALIRSARKQLVFENQYINMNGADSGYLEKLVDLLVRKSRQLDDFRMVLRSGMSGFWENMEALKRRGMDVENQVRQLPNVHTKGIVVDGKRVLLGSHNWSSLGVTLNRDASLIFHDEEIAQYYLEAFEIDWARAHEIELESAVEEGVRVASGAEPPVGFRRMRLTEHFDP